MLVTKLGEAEAPSLVTTLLPTDSLSTPKPDTDPDSRLSFFLLLVNHSGYKVGGRNDFILLPAAYRSPYEAGR